MNGILTCEDLRYLYKETMLPSTFPPSYSRKEIVEEIINKGSDRPVGTRFEIDGVHLTTRMLTLAGSVPPIVRSIDGSLTVAYCSLSGLDCLPYIAGETHRRELSLLGVDFQSSQGLQKDFKGVINMTGCSGTLDTIPCGASSLICREVEGLLLAPTAFSEDSGTTVYLDSGCFSIGRDVRAASDRIWAEPLENMPLYLLDRKSPMICWLATSRMKLSGLA